MIRTGACRLLFSTSRWSLRMGCRRPRSLRWRRRVVALRRLHGESALFCCQDDVAEIAAGRSLIRDVSDAVLIAEFLLDAGIDVRDRLFFCHFKKSSSGLAGDLFQNF